MSNAYEKAGVNLQSGYESIERIKKHIKRTERPEVLAGIGGFGSLFSLKDLHMEEPILVSGTDGVGTKILLAQQAEMYDTIGIDCVAMCVNDVLAQGALPLFFLDYLAVGNNDPVVVEQIVAGVAEGCVQSHAALIGGETAEMPDLYDEKEFDLAGFAVGIVDRQNILTPENVTAGDVLIGLPSNGIHSNGYSLVRKLFFKDHDWSFEDELPSGTKLIDELLKPTKIYVEDLMPLLEDELVHGVAHMTGGGFYENVPRMMTTDLRAEINIDGWETPEIFDVMQELGEISTKEMFNIFNMGIGMVIAVAPENIDAALEQLENAVVLGEVFEREAEEAEVILK